MRIAALLNVIGREGVDLYETFQWLADEDKTKIENVVRKFDENCIPRTNETYESYRFFKRSQNAGETVEAYITALYKLSATCNVGSLRERLIRDRLVIGVRDEQAREKLLAKDNLNLETCIDMLKTLQVTHTRAQEMNTEITTHTVRCQTSHQPQPVHIMQVMAIFQEGSTGQVLASTYPSVAGVHYLLVRDDRCVVVVGVHTQSGRTNAQLVEPPAIRAGNTTTTPRCAEVETHIKLLKSFTQ